MRQFAAAILQHIPGLPAALGRSNFQHHIGHPAPAHVSSLTTLLKLNLTLFRFQPPFDRDNILQHFDQTDMVGWPIHRVLLIDHLGQPTRQFHRVLHPDLTTLWLCSNPTTG